MNRFNAIFGGHVSMFGFIKWIIFQFRFAVEKWNFIYFFFPRNAGGWDNQWKWREKQISTAGFSEKLLFFFSLLFHCSIEKERTKGRNSNETVFYFFFFEQKRIFSAKIFDFFFLLLYFICVRIACVRFIVYSEQELFF